MTFENLTATSPTDACSCIRCAGDALRKDLSKSEAKAQSLSIENDLLRAAPWRSPDHEYDADVNRGLVLELLDMLGKKARRRNKKRLREVRLAVAMDVPGDDEVVS